MLVRSLPAILFLPALCGAQSLSGLWDATVTVPDAALTVPFRMALSGAGNKVQASLINGDEKFTSTSGSFQNDLLTVNFDHFATRLTATYRDGKLTGRYSRGPKGTYLFAAQRFQPSPLTADQVPSIAGLFTIPIQSPKGESAWRFIVRQSGAEVSAAILRIDGDTGTLYGKYQDGKFLLSHFAGGTPLLIEVTPQKDGSLQLVRNGTDHWIAVKSTLARTQSLPEPTDPSRHTSVEDPTVPFQFAFPDLTGKIVSNTDAKFRDKVILVAIGGSWCPNCHDEAPFLEALYRQYRARGLEIVSLSFEEIEQQGSLERLHAFIKRYGIDYTVLMPGNPDELQAKLPQTVNLNSWPTTIFLGRDGKVRSVHAGFAGPASGDFHRQQKEEITALVEKLLSENTVSSR